MSFKNRRFYHNGIVYEFKWAKIEYVTKNMPPYLADRITDYFDYINSDDFPDDLFNDKKVQRCSNFRVKYLKRGGRDKISQKLIKEKKVFHEDFENNTYDKNIPPIVKDIMDSTRELFFETITKGFTKPNHDQVLTKCLLNVDNAISVETPVWTRKQSTLQDFMCSPEDGDFKFHYCYSLTGHIDLLVYDEQNREIIVVDYKPEGQFIKSIPQVGGYGLILKRILNLDSIKCLSFRKEDAWYYDPEVIRKDIDEEISQTKLAKRPRLKWRRILKGI